MGKHITKSNLNRDLKGKRKNQMAGVCVACWWTHPSGGPTPTGGDATRRTAAGGGLAPQVVRERRRNPAASWSRPCAVCPGQRCGRRCVAAGGLGSALCFCAGALVSVWGRKHIGTYRRSIYFLFFNIAVIRDTYGCIRYVSVSDNTSDTDKLPVNRIWVSLGVAASFRYVWSYDYQEYVKNTHVV